MDKIGAVGSSATASRKESSQVDEVFDGRVSIRRADDGTFVINASYRSVPKPGRKAGRDCFPGYCPDKEFTADSLKDAFAKAQALFGAK